MGDFHTLVLMRDARFHAPARVQELALLEPGTRAAVQRMLVQARAEGAPLYVFETYRSRERQRLLFEQGVTQLQEVGVHHYGLACDLVRIVDGALSWEADYSVVGRLAHANGLIWGGDWGHPERKPGFVDSAHVQRCPVERQAELFAGAWYPTASYDPYSDPALVDSGRA